MFFFKRKKPQTEKTDISSGYICFGEISGERAVWHIRGCSGEFSEATLSMEGFAIKKAVCPQTEFICTRTGKQSRQREKHIYKQEWDALIKKLFGGECEIDILAFEKKEIPGKGVRINAVLNSCGYETPERFYLSVTVECTSVSVVPKGVLNVGND